MMQRLEVSISFLKKSYMHVDKDIIDGVSRKFFIFQNSECFISERKVGLHACNDEYQCNVMHVLQFRYMDS